MDKKAILIHSGGLDSSTLLYDLLDKGYKVYTISFDYGQKHKKELVCAVTLAKKLEIEHKIIDISSVNQVLDSTLTREDKIPEGHYEEESMKQTVVPNRNMIMLSIATAYAVSLKIDEVYFGAHAGDHAIYPDCRLQFVKRMNLVTEIANYHPVKIIAPYLKLTKGEIVKIGKKLMVDFSLTWTCYNGRNKACGKCGACQERLEAMKFADIIDPIEYEV